MAWNSVVAIPAFLCFGLLLAASPALAKNDGHGKHEDKEHGQHARGADKDNRGHDGSGWLIHNSDADIIRSYLSAQSSHDHAGAGHAHKKCPPGLAKKQNGCLPPGIAKKYEIGNVLHDGVWVPLPEELRLRLRPPPGHHYVQIDRDIVLIAEASKKIIDAVTLLSAVR